MVDGTAEQHQTKNPGTQYIAWISSMSRSKWPPWDTMHECTSRSWIASLFECSRLCQNTVTGYIDMVLKGLNIRNRFNVHNAFQMAPQVKFQGGLSPVIKQAMFLHIWCMHSLWPPCTFVCLKEPMLTQTPISGSKIFSDEGGADCQGTWLGTFVLPLDRFHLLGHTRTLSRFVRGLNTGASCF